jgi:two-component system, cell cycle sensor histidine kinase and response regulator CckA
MPRVLVVDDEESIRRFAGRALRDAGYEVVVASDGPEALRIVEEQGPFDVFVIDLMMPHMRGDELAGHLRRMHPDVKVLYFTGYIDRLFERRKALWEHEAIVEKPVTVKGLREAVSLLLFGHTQGLAL